MKKLGLIVMVILGAFSVNAQEIFKTVENSSVQVNEWTTYAVDGVGNAKVVDMDLSLSDSIVEFTIYLSFYEVDTSGTFSVIPRSGMNADREDFFKGVKAAIAAQGVSEPNLTPAANEQTNSIMRAMLSGTRDQKYAAYNAILTGYGAPLLPLDEQ